MTQTIRTGLNLKPKNFPTIREALLAQAEEAADNALMLSNDSKIMYGLWKALPSIILLPDAVFTRSALTIDFDAVFFYDVMDDEEPDALRLMLTLMFRVGEWFVLEEKDTHECILQGEARFDDYKVLVRIRKVDPYKFTLKQMYEDETCITHKILDSKFVPFECKHEEITTTQLAQKIFEYGLNAKCGSMEGNLLSALADAIDFSTPIPDSIVVLFGLDFDIEFIYIQDERAYFRKALTHVLGPCKWNGVWHKKMATFTLHSQIEVPVKNNKLRLKLTILNAKRTNEHLAYMGETDDVILYRSLRPGDPDYSEFVKD